MGFFLSASRLIALLLWSSEIVQADTKNPLTTILQDVRVFSEKTGGFEDHMSIKIDDGIITGIAKNFETKGTRLIQLQNRFAIPGLIDAHVHLKAIPGSIQRQDSKEATRSFFAQEMRAYIASGVTSVLDAAAPPSVVQQVNDYSNSGAPGPTVFFLRPFITPQNGYFATLKLRTPAFSDLTAPVETTNDIATILNAHRGQRDVGAKVTFEDGFGPLAVWRTFDKAMRDTITREAQRRGIPLFIHSMKEAMTALALDLKPRGLMHVGFQHGGPSEELLKSIKTSGASVVSTQAVFDMPLVAYERDRLESAWVQSIVPKSQLDTAKDASVIDSWKKSMVEANAPSWMPGFLTGLATSIFYNEREIRSQLSSTKLALKKMYEAKIPIVMGSDAGCWPMIPFMFHGVSSIREIEVMIEAGIPAPEVIRAATINAAQMMGVDSSLGSLSIGKTADLVIYDINPTVDIKAFRIPAYVMKSGVLQTPAQWLDEYNAP